MEYNSIESMFPGYLKVMTELFGDRISKEIDYIDQLCHPSLEKSHFDKVLDKFLKPMKVKDPNFSNYVFDFVVCVLYYNSMLTAENLLESMRLFEDDLLDIYECQGYGSNIHSFRTAGFEVNFRDSNKNINRFFGDYSLFDWDLLPIVIV